MYGGFDEGEKKRSKSETSIDHNVTPDQEKKVEPAAGSRQDYVAVKLRRYL